MNFMVDDVRSLLASSNQKTNITQNQGPFMNLEFADPSSGNDVLENFDFDSFLHTDADQSLGMDFSYDGGPIEAGSGI